MPLQSLFSCSEAIMCLLQIITLPDCEEDWGHKGVQSHDANTGAAAVDEKAHLGMK